MVALPPQAPLSAVKRHQARSRGFMIKKDSKLIRPSTDSGRCRPGLPASTLQRFCSSPLRAKPGPRSLSRASWARLFYSSALVSEGHLVIARRFNAGSPGPLSQVPKGRLKSNQNPAPSNPKILVSRLPSSGLLAHSSATKRCQAHQGGKYFVPETAKTLESLGKSTKKAPKTPLKNCKKYATFATTQANQPENA